MFNSRLGLMGLVFLFFPVRCAVLLSDAWLPAASAKYWACTLVTSRSEFLMHLAERADTMCACRLDMRCVLCAVVPFKSYDSCGSNIMCLRGGTMSTLVFCLRGTLAMNACSMHLQASRSGAFSCHGFFSCSLTFAWSGSSHARLPSMRCPGTEAPSHGALKAQASHRVPAPRVPPIKRSAHYPLGLSHRHSYHAPRPSPQLARHRLSTMAKFQRRMAHISDKRGKDRLCRKPSRSRADS